MVFLRIDKRGIGEEERCYIIAEAGSNHNQNFDRAKKLIDVAADARVDAVKFQTYSADKLYSAKTPIFPGEDKKPYEVVKNVEIPREWQADLMKYAKQKGLTFLSTPFDYEAVDELEELGISAYKWASSTITDLPMLKYAAKKGKPMLLSTGMSDLADIQNAINAVYSTGNKRIALLHCTSVYPCPASEVNLRMMDTIRDAFHLPTGFSDHSLGTAIPVAAVARGAKMLEKHFTLDRSLEGPDHPFAMEPQELKEMVSMVREVEESLGSPIKEATPGEREKVELSRRSIIAAEDISKGQKIERGMLMVKRPGFGISPDLIDVVVGRHAKEEIKKDTWITWDMI